MLLQGCACLMRLVHHISLLYVGVNSIIFYELQNHSMYLNFTKYCLQWNSLYLNSSKMTGFGFERLTVIQLNQPLAPTTLTPPPTTTITTAFLKTRRFNFKTSLRSFFCGSVINHFVVFSLCLQMLG